MDILRVERYRSTLLFYLLNLIIILPVFSQEVKTEKSGKYLGEHKVKSFSYTLPSDKVRVKNIVLMIGDGMGITHITAAMIANKGELYMENFPVGGFMKIHSASGAETDSGASATAMSTGKKTYNGMIGIDKYEKAQRTIIELAESKGFATGIVVTASVTHATPAAFISHVYSRNYYEMIADQYLNTDIDVFIGGGRKNFMDRMDKRNLVVDLMKKDYQVIVNRRNLDEVNSGKLAALLYENHPPAVMTGRENLLENWTAKALQLLSQNDKGFFLLVEGSQIDWGGHANDLSYIIEETLDFDKAIGTVLEFAAEDRETLVIVTADHETGGLAIHGGDLKKGTMEGGFTTKGHSATMVPVFAFGPRAEEFGGIYDNTEIFKKITKLLFNR